MMKDSVALINPQSEIRIPQSSHPPPTARGTVPTAPPAFEQIRETLYAIHRQQIGKKLKRRSTEGKDYVMSASKDSLTITDNRTGKQYEVPVKDGTIRAMDLRQIKTGDEDFGLMTYDPAFMNTASCKSTITYIDGDRGVLEYRGYPIEQLAEQSNYLEV